MDVTGMTLNLNLWIVNRFDFCWETNSPLRRRDVRLRRYGGRLFIA
jgi:hypothetical protein